MIMLTGLPLEEYDGVSRNMEDNERVNTVEVKRKLLTEESRRVRISSSKKEDEVQANFVSGHQYYTRGMEDEELNQEKTHQCFKCGKQGHDVKYCRNRAKCHNCGRLGHIMRDCRLSRRIIHHQQWSSESVSASASKVKASEVVDKRFQVNVEKLHGREIKPDNGLEFMNKDFQEQLQKSGFIHQSQVCPRDLGIEVVVTAVYVRNRVASAALAFQIPFELRWNRALDEEEVRKIKVFGCRAFAVRENAGKLDARAEECSVDTVGTKKIDVLELELGNEQGIEELVVKNFSNNDLLVEADKQSGSVEPVIVESELRRSCRKEKQEVIITKSELSAELNIGDLGSATNVSSIHIEQSVDSITLCQSRFIHKILEDFSMQMCKPCQTILPSGFVDATDNESEFDCTIYRQAVGSLLYLANNTRPDIMFAVSHVSQRCQKPTVRDWKEVKHTIRYLNGSKDLKLCFKRSDGVLKVCYDADWGKNMERKKSITGKWECCIQGCGLYARTNLLVDYVVDLCPVDYCSR
ncbi:hypothetical protein PR048_027514 [Dryococelus australis]|uniref:CCHC-type domain-containing protein n=1 Tax=Dryococelus australis TaxID=614101 RepID=A0ABQ9GGR7_9NEOP|nr:hypothetical protein PR048_027514 [Dryococelus australis]